MNDGTFFTNGTYSGERLKNELARMNASLERITADYKQHVHLGSFLGPDGPDGCRRLNPHPDVHPEDGGISEDLLFQYLDTLKDLSVNGIQGNFPKNGGAFSNGGPLSEMPTLTIRTASGTCDLVLEGYVGEAYRSSTLDVYISKNTQAPLMSSAQQILTEHFPRAEFEPTDLASTLHTLEHPETH